MWRVVSCRTLNCELKRPTLCSSSTALLAEIIVVCEENKDSNYAHPLISPISSSRLHQHQHTSSLLCSVNRIQSHCWAVNLPSINLGPIQRLLDTNTQFGLPECWGWEGGRVTLSVVRRGVTGRLCAGRWRKLVNTVYWHSVVGRDTAPARDHFLGRGQKLQR